MQNTFLHKTVFRSPFVENLGSEGRESEGGKESHLLKRPWHIHEIRQSEKNYARVSGRQIRDGSSAHPATGPACTGFAPALSLTTTMRIIYPNQRTAFSYGRVHNTEELAQSHPLNTMVSELAIYLSPFISPTEQCLANP